LARLVNRKRDPSAHQEPFRGIRSFRFEERADRLLAAALE
jgi:hypothetical protein